jgi:hypothetical protein
MFSDPEYGAMTLPCVVNEIFQTQKFKDKYPWRRNYKNKINPKSHINHDDYKLAFSAVNALIDIGTENEKTGRLFDLSKADKEVAAFAIAHGCEISTGDQGIIDLMAQEFSEEFQGNLSPLELINVWLVAGLLHWDESRHRILEEWAITEERPQPLAAIKKFTELTGQKYPGP